MTVALRPLEDSEGGRRLPSSKTQGPPTASPALFDHTDPILDFRKEKETSPMKKWLTLVAVLALVVPASLAARGGWGSDFGHGHRMWSHEIGRAHV